MSLEREEYFPVNALRLEVLTLPFFVMSFILILNPVSNSFPGSWTFKISWHALRGAAHLSS